MLPCRAAGVRAVARVSGPRCPPRPDRTRSRAEEDTGIGAHPAKQVGAPWEANRPMSPAAATGRAATGVPAPLPCGMSRPTVKRSEPAGWAGCGYCASRARFFRGLRLYLVCTPAGLPVLWAPAAPGPRAASRPSWPRCSSTTPGSWPTAPDWSWPPTRASPPKPWRPIWPGEPLLESVRRRIESVNAPLKGRLGLEAHGGRTLEGGDGAGGPAHPRADRRRPARPPHWPAHPAVTHRL